MRAALLISLCLLPLVSVADNALWQKLQREPHMVVFMRNAESSGNQDGANMLTWDPSGKCSGESALTVEGKAQAGRIGEAFSKRGVKPLVISSPMCRCTETAQIAFGKFLMDPDLRQRHPEDAKGRAAFLKIATILLAEHRGKSPIVFVNHRPNIDSLTMELIDIGELLVGTVSGDGEIEILGNIRLER